LLSLPLWNFVLPVYAFWHFDDFTWGETRKVQGEGKEVHGTNEGTFDSSQIEMRRWSEFERDRKALQIQLDQEYREMELKDEEEAKKQQESERLNEQAQQQAMEAELQIQAGLIEMEAAETISSPQSPTHPTPPPPPPPPSEESWEALAAAGMAWSELI
jgi:hypothetical protein